MDPSQFSQGTVSASGDAYWSNVAPALTVQPYAIANNLPYRVVSTFAITDPNSAQLTSDFFFTGGAFSTREKCSWGGRTFRALRPSMPCSQAIFQTVQPQPRPFGRLRLRLPLDRQARRQREFDGRLLAVRGHQFCHAAGRASSVLTTVVRMGKFFWTVPMVAEKNTNRN